jgi:hypothetical protein
MNNKKTKPETRGRKSLSEDEKKKAVFIMVKGKYVEEVMIKLREIEKEYHIK